MSTTVLFALEREARPFRKLCPQVTVLLTGVGVERARTAIEALLATSKPDLVILAGFGGSLTTAARIGDVYVAREVCDENGNVWPCADGGSARVLTVDRLIASVEEKALLAAKHDAEVCDMESSAVAEACRKHGVKFLAVRAISDTADHSLPPQLDDIVQNGIVSKWRAIRALVRKPAIVKDFWRLARDTKLAAGNLAIEIQALLSSR